MTKIKLITFDLDDTLWDNKPTITNAEIQTRKWVEERVGKIEWGNLDDFINLRNDLIKKDRSIAWDISKLRKEIFKIKISNLVPPSKVNILANNAFDFFIDKRHEISLYNNVAEALLRLSEKYTLGVLTNGNADIFRLEVGKYFQFSISSLEAKNSKPHRAHFDIASQQADAIDFNNMLHIGDHQVNDVLAAYQLGIETLWFNNKNAEWTQNFTKPAEFSDWQKLPEIIEGLYE
jgi:putative hydrolase of the HAD superfamily